jgi:predicted aldo/keto reductase-like oxidoreductase
MRTIWPSKDIDVGHSGFTTFNTKSKCSYINKCLTTQIKINDYVFSSSKKKLIMQYRKMGNLDWKGSALGFGCMRFPSKKVLFWKKVDEEEAIRILRYGIDQGINYIDTAYGYHLGKSEVIVGKALQNGYREKVHLVTKCPMWKIRKAEDFDKYLRIQLDRLQTDHLDIYLFHALGKKRFELIKELNLIKKMEEAKAKGLIKHIGFSFHDNFQVFKEIVDYYHWDVCLVQHNYMDTMNQATSEGLKYAASKGLAVNIMEPLRGGRLANPSAEIKAIMETSPVKRTPVDWALQFLWNKPEVSVVLSGMGSMEQLQANLISAEKSGINSLTAEENKILEKVADLFRKQILVNCTGCEYCLPCPNGVKISQNFSLINNYSMNKNLKAAQKEYTKLLKENGTADACVECGKCVDVCPQSIEIPSMLKKVQQVLGNKQSLSEVFK